MHDAYINIACMLFALHSLQRADEVLHSKIFSALSRCLHSSQMRSLCRNSCIVWSLDLKVHYRYIIIDHIYIVHIHKICTLILYILHYDTRHSV